MKLTLAEVHSEISVHLAEISRLFKNPKITIIVRAPDQPDGDVILSDDDLDRVIAAIENLKGRDPFFKGDGK